MGLIDVYRMMEQPKALSIADKLADWFLSMERQIYQGRV